MSKRCGADATDASATDASTTDASTDACAYAGADTSAATDASTTTDASTPGNCATFRLSYQRHFRMPSGDSSSN